MNTRLVAIIAAVFVVAAVIVKPFECLAAAETVDGIEWAYTVKDGIATVGWGRTLQPAIDKTTTGPVVIPCELGGYPVKKLAAYAFVGCDRITSVEIPATVGVILYEAFASCTNLTSVTIPNSVTNIDIGAFRNCSALGSVTIPDSVTWIGGEPFSGCVNLTNVVMSGSLTNLAGTFSGCPRLESVKISRGVKNIGPNTFLNCSSLSSVSIPDTVTSIGDSAFKNCGSLKSIEIPGSVTNIGAQAFWESGLTGIAIPDTVASIGEWAFSRCGALESVEIGSGLESIGKEAFTLCGALTSFEVSAGNPNFLMAAGRLMTSKDGKTLVAGMNIVGHVVIPEGVERIGDYALSSSGGMTGVEIPNTVKDIGKHAFETCGGLTGVDFPESVVNIDYGAFQNCDGLTSVTIPGSVTNIGDFAFAECDRMTTAYLPMSLKGIAYESRVFYTPTTKIKYRQKDGPYEVGEPVVWANTVSGGQEYFSQTPPINESNLDFMIPATDDLPAGAKVRIKKITFASVNDSFKVWDVSTSKSDPSFVRLNGVNSDKTTGFSGIVRTTPHEEHNALVYTFSSPCDVIVGRKYAAVSGNNAGGAGDGIALLHSNGNLLYGSGADRASVGYVRTSDANSIMSTTSAESITGQTGYYPVYRVEAEVVALEPSALDGGTFVEYSGVQTSDSNFPYRNIAARTTPFSFMLYADVSAMPSSGKAVICEFGNLWSHMAILYREGDEVKFGLGNANGVFGTVASVAVQPGTHLYTAVCDPTTGYSYLRLDGGEETVGFSGGAASLGNGFQIGSIYGGIGNTFIDGKNLTVVKLLGYEAAFTKRDIASFVAQYPADVEALPKVGSQEELEQAKAGMGPTLAAHIDTVEEYNALREWAQKLESAGVATKGEICAAPTAYLSFALDAAGLVEEPKEGDLKVDALASASGGAMEAVVSLDGVEIGSNAAEARLKEVFEAVGADELDLRKFSSDSVTLSLSPAEGGKMKATVAPKNAAESFFIRIRLAR